MSDSKYYVYIIELSHPELSEFRWYVGMTEDPDRRWEEHQDGRGSKFTSDADLHEMYRVGAVERRTDALKAENYVTDFLRSEFGRLSVTGGDDVKRNRQPAPEDDVLLPPALGRALKKCGHPEIARAAARQTGVKLTITDSLRFNDVDEAADWADEALPDGTQVEIEVPLWRNKYRGEADSNSEPRN